MNNITTLRNHLFEQLDRLRKSNGDDLKEEIDKSKAIIEVSSEILRTANVEADIIKSVKELASGFVPDAIGHIVNKQIEEKEKPYEFQKSSDNLLNE